MVRFRKDDRKADVMKPHLEKATRPGVVAIGVAQEFQSVFTGYDRKVSRPGAARFGFQKADRRVTVYYFYVLDDDFGPGFVKICSYLGVLTHPHPSQPTTPAGVSTDSHTSPSTSS